ncbi:MAG: protein translocase subunit SecD [Candidatus Caldipriscus sp.]|nr:protein translocase subunit SecD [Candidatus Caldipriscus sp.]
MSNKNLIRLIVIILTFVVPLWLLQPTYKVLTMSESEKEKLNPLEFQKLMRNSLNLGLDIQGGMYVVLGVDKDKVKGEHIKDAADRVVEVIRNRVDQLGVFEPVIQKVGEDRVVVQLPGVISKERARMILGKTALLEFKLLADENLFADFIRGVDRILRGGEIFGADTLRGPFSSLLVALEGDVAVAEESWAKVDSILKLPEVQNLIPVGYEILWGATQEVQGKKFRKLYMVKAETPLTGAYLMDANATIGQQQAAGQPVVQIRFDRTGAAIFARITGENVGKRLAIVLDGVVQSAPRIQERIPTGNAQITGIRSLREAQDLAAILRAGALPVPVKIEEERVIGPSLGKDSIQKGMIALAVAFILVIAFMIFYYRIGGIIANIALFANLILILAIMAMINATLTMPGMAGLILTVGMAVDSNVLIFERMREELRKGNPFRTALESGYSNARRTILDANITTLLTALVLMFLGTGPIRGFAVVLSIGILVNFFTSIVMTRWIFDILLEELKWKEVAI